MTNENGSTERRRADRRPFEQALTIKVIASTTPVIRPGRTLHCESHDISADGLRIKTNEPVPADVYLELWVTSPEHRDTLILRGIVRWSREVEPGAHAAGIELIPDSATNMDAWRAMVSAMVRGPQAPTEIAPG